MKIHFISHVVAFVVTCLALLSAPVVHADMLAGEGTMYTNYFRYLNDTNNGGWHWATPIAGEEVVTGQLLNLFCVDSYTKTSEAFADTNVGQLYHGGSLADSALYTTSQKNALNSLFSHVYSSIVDSNNILIESVMAQTFQLVVWEIVHETGGNWDITSGSFGINAAASYRPDNTSYINTTVFNEAKQYAADWFSAISNDALWSSLGYEYTDLELTVYVADGGTMASQTLISTTPPVATTPEPASLLIFAVGLAALPLSRYRRRHVK